MKNQILATLTMTLLGLSACNQGGASVAAAESCAQFVCSSQLYYRNDNGDPVIKCSGSAEAAIALIGSEADSDLSFDRVEDEYDGLGAHTQRPEEAQVWVSYDSLVVLNPEDENDIVAIGNKRSFFITPSEEIADEEALAFVKAYEGVCSQ